MGSGCVRVSGRECGWIACDYRVAAEEVGSGNRVGWCFVYMGGGGVGVKLGRYPCRLFLCENLELQLDLSFFLLLLS